MRNRNEKLCEKEKRRGKIEYDPANSADTMSGIGQTAKVTE